MKASAKAPSRRVRWGWGAVWAVALAMALGCLGRLMFHDRLLPLIWVNSFTTYIYLPALPLLLLALRKGKAQLAAILMMVTAFYLTWTVPDFVPRAASGPQPASTSATASAKLRLFSANVFSRDSYPIIIERIGQIDPDIVLLQEYTHSWRDAWERSNLLQLYSHSETLTREGSFGIAILSKMPLEDARLLQVNLVSAISATVVIEKRRCRLWHVHGPSPRFLGVVPKLDAYWEEVVGQLRGETLPLIVAGDFNLTQHARWYARLKQLGLHSAHRECGRGYATTWPNGTWGFIPPIRIDHVLLSANVRCTEVWEDEGQLSDHKPLVADLEIAGK